MRKDYWNIIKEFANQNKVYFAFLAVLSLITSVFSVSTVAFILPVLNFIETNGSVDISEGYWSIINSLFEVLNLDLNIYSLAILNLAIVFTFQVIDYFRLIYIQNLYPLGMTFVRKKLMRTFLLDDYLKINAHSKSSLVTLYSVHASEYGNLFYRMFVLFFLVIQILFFTLVLSFINYNLLFMITSYIIAITYVTRNRGKYALHSGKVIANINDQILQRVTEILDSLKISKVFNFEEELYKKSVQDSDHLQNKSMSIYKTSSLLIFIDTFNFIFLMSILIVSYKYFELPLSEIVTFLFLLFRLVPNLKQFNLEKVEINAKLESALKIKRLVDESKDTKKFEKYERTNSLSKIQISDVSFKYKSKTVLSNVTLTFGKSKRYAIKGRSGSGKSTLVDLILGLISTDSGKILYYNDHDQSIDRRTINTFYLSQNPFILTGTVRDNLLFGLNDVADFDETLNVALRHVDLENYFGNLEGLETVVQENGANLSGGQKQRLALARLFVRHYDLIVLDEHTSAIDTESVTIINRAIKNIENSTIISVTHNTTVMDDADVVIELEDTSVKSLRVHK